MYNLRLIIILLVAAHIMLGVSFSPLFNVINDLASETQVESEIQESQMSASYKNRVIPIAASVVAVLLSTASVIFAVKGLKSVTRRRWVWYLGLVWGIWLLVMAAGMVLMLPHIYYMVASNH